MNRNLIYVSFCASFCIMSLTACNGATSPKSTASGLSSSATQSAKGVPLSQPTSPIPTPTSALNLMLGVSGSGEVKAAQDADLVFTVPGTVAEVLVAEGDSVTSGQRLIVLDTHPFELDIKRAEAALAGAQAQQRSLTENPRTADVTAAEAQMHQAQASLAQLQAGPKSQDIESTKAALSAAEANLQASRDRLSAAKINTQLQMEQAANALRNAQDAYSRIYWENRNLEDQLSKFGRELPQAAKDQEAGVLRAVENAEVALDQAKLAFQQALQAEVTGIQAAEQQVVQSQMAVERIQLPPDADRMAAAQAALAQAQASRSRLNPNPTKSQQAQVEAGVAQAQVALELAQFNREKAELRAPFDGVIAFLNLDPGDPAATGALPAIRIVDMSELYVDVPISDVDITRVTLGQKANLYVEALPDKVFTGKVSYIAPTAVVVGNVRNFLVRIDLDDQTGLFAGMSIRVDLLTEE